MQTKFTEKAYNKSKTVRKLLREEMFQRNRNTSQNSSYMSYYDKQTQQQIKYSLQASLTAVDQLPAPSNANPLTISYYRRAGKPIFKTKVAPDMALDPHMTFESLCILAGIQDIQNYPNSQKVIKEFQDNLNQYLNMPYSQIKEMAIIAAGNKILGKQEDIIRIVNQDENQLWVLVNHIYERKISYSIMYRYLDRGLPIIYRTIYEMTNNQKDEIIESIIKNEEILEIIIGALANSNPQIQLYAVRIIGNILAQKDDYTQLFSRLQLLDLLYAALKSTDKEVRKDILWLLSNYISENGPADEILCKQQLYEKLLLLYKNQQSQKIKVEMYHVLTCLAFYGNQRKVYEMALHEDILQHCCSDIEIQNQNLTLIILTLISKLVQIGEEFIGEQEQSTRNPFIDYILNSKLKTYIHSKTYSQNQSISNVSFDIIAIIDDYTAKFGEDQM